MAELNERFIAGLEHIRALAGKNQGTVTVRDILDAFPGEALSENQIRQIYEYLEDEDIRLADYTPHDTSSMSLSELSEEAEAARPMDEEDQKLFDLYMEELAGIPHIGAEEEKKLCGILSTGNAAAKKAACDRLTEGNLHWVVKLAAGFAGQGVTVSDLIQEGNMALFLALSEYDGTSELSQWLEKRIKDAMRSMVRTQQGYDKAELRMAAEANRILEATKEMEEELGRAVTPEELAKRLGMTPARVNEVLQESARAIRLEER